MIAHSPEEESPRLDDPRKFCVLHLPHASRIVPADERARLAVSDAELQAELLRMTDAFTDELFPPTPQEFARIVFPVSRLVCDVERFPHDADEPMAARGMGAVYNATSTGSRLRAAPPPAERERIMARWYRPHHALLTSATDQVLVREGRCLILDCHSFSARPLLHEPDQDPQRPDICLGTDPFHTPPGLALVVARAVSDLGLTVDFDRPFAGALVPAKHYRRDDRVKPLMIEVNRRLYMNEVSGERLISFESMKRALGNLLAAAISFVGKS